MPSDDGTGRFASTEGVVSTAALPIVAAPSAFAAGTGLWAAGLALVSTSPAVPRVVRLTGAIAAVLLATTALRIFEGLA